MVPLSVLLVNFGKMIVAFLSKKVNYNDIILSINNCLYYYSFSVKITVSIFCRFSQKLSATLLPSQLARRNAKAFLKCPVEGGVVRKARLLGSPDYRGPRPDQAGGLEQPLLTDVAVNGRTGLCFKKAHEVVLAEVDQIGQLFHRQRLRDMLVDVG